MIVFNNPDSSQFTCLTGKLKSAITRVLVLVFLSTVTSFAANAQETQPWINMGLNIYDDTPIEVLVGVKIDQITSVDQKSENFSMVGDIKLEWQDSNLAFKPAPGEIPVRRYQTNVFIKITDEENIFFPSYRISNQQGKRFSEDSGVAVFPDGKAVFGERFTVTLQAPDFDFKTYPFDSQRFFISIDTQWPNSTMKFVADDKFGGLGDQLGEEEWVFEEADSISTTHVNILGDPASRINFVFYAHRHIWYYILRIIVPLIVIVAVSWATFFLRDFSKRVDISGGNLLVYVAFNFTISNDLPRLGYLTFLDTILAAAFIITGLTVIFNVLLRRLELEGRENLARVIDTYTLWIYPAAFMLVVLFAWNFFFQHSTITELMTKF
jgi:hypothetical protein